MDDVVAIQGISHLSLSVTDLDASLVFYRDVLGLTVLRQPYAADAFCGRQAMLAASRILLALQQHDANDGSPFDAATTGLDHLSFHVSNVQGLRGWLERLDAHGIDHSDVLDVEGFGWMVELRDPDGIQLELFTTSADS